VLSGGEKQRVALARALVNEPKVLLLDEPLAALDLHLRRQLRTELRALQRRTGITFILVTHDQEEALSLCDHMALLRAGRVEQMGTAEALYLRPDNRFVAEFLGACNLIDARLIGVGPEMATAETGFGVLQMPIARLGAGLQAGSRMTLGVRPERLIVVGATMPTATNEVPARVVGRTYTGADSECLLALGAAAVQVRIRVTHQGPSQCSLAVGDSMILRFPPDALMGWGAEGLS
jgi:spermidine/putrescine transport system ATP-binding protein